MLGKTSSWSGQQRAHARVIYANKERKFCSVDMSAHAQVYRPHVHSCIKKQRARPRSLVAERNTNASHLWLRQCTRIIRCLIYGDIKVTRKEKTRARGHLWSETRSAIHGTSQITNEMPIRSRNKRRLQGRPNARWPAQTLSICAKTHKHHEKGRNPIKEGTQTSSTW